MTFLTSSLIFDSSFSDFKSIYKKAVTVVAIATLDTAGN